ncbi:Fatty acid hydroxylase superfamily protein [Hartmannibacter diazotrophicus]|uniref:Fatty acid hydroxylase superfamily protein n=1 Tax=Hartmannibacter diazotrophicus TaxID=1482074 RepID=A0A2C9D2E1_9HYPH|nr:sterol desaturase family protein [Hartmannibacter diazotrophicus]SON54403.1 Fatty acid hydroxylase superfamily protein [Hartmannibacter diazotrophicus]
MPTLPTFSDHSSLRLTVLGLALGFMLLEYLLSRLASHDHETHDLKESAASLVLAVGQNLLRGLEAGLVALPFALAYEHRLFDFDTFTVTALLALFILTEFVYYWHHRASHRVRWLWATHAVHHSATKLNFTAAIRLGWTGNISGHFVFFLPIVWLGFNPFALIGMLGINLLYQFFLHTEFGPRLGPLEWVLNTPTHHRVHHACNRDCLDKNYGGMLIVFDRLFGTFTEAPAGEPLRYGLVGVRPSNNPLSIALGEWGRMIRDVRQADGLGAKLAVILAPPGSKPKRREEARLDRPVTEKR